MGSQMPEMPHVCFLSCQHSPDDMRVTHKKARNLCEEGFRVTWVGPEGRIPEPDYGIQFITYPRTAPKIMRPLRLISLYNLAREVEGVDVYYGLEPDSALVANFLAKRRHASSVFALHEMYHREMLTTWGLRGRGMDLSSALVRRAIASIVARSDLIVGAGHTRTAPYKTVAKEEMVVRGCVPKSAIPGTVSNPFGSAAVRLMHGKLGVNNGTMAAIETLRLLRRELGTQASLVVYGNKGSALSEPGIELRQRVPFAQFLNDLLDCDAGLIMYSRLYGVKCMPNRAFEYMAVGLPVVAPDFAEEIGAIVEETGCGVLVDVEKPERVAEAILDLAKDPAKARKMGANGRRAFEERFNWEVESEPLRAWLASRRRWRSA
jgi:glycosyltransferase involved in cell wall biosynthesis